jgi:translation initiation factor IF-3
LSEADPNLVRNLNHLPEQVRLVDLDRTWVASRHEVEDRIRETALDLYLVNREVNPPVYKIMDYGRYRYDQQKKAREQKKKMRELNRPIKEFKFKPSIDDHDVEVKVHHIRENLPDHDIKICMDLKRNAFVLTNRWSRSIAEVVADENFVLNRVLAALTDVVQPSRLNISDNQIGTVLKYNGQILSN